MGNRVALIGIVVEDMEKVSELNTLLHEYSDYIIGRMGLPYKNREISIISIAIDAPSDLINSLCGKIGKIKGITSKTLYAKMNEE